MCSLTLTSLVGGHNDSNSSDTTTLSIDLTRSDDDVVEMNDAVILPVVNLLP
jgi:hypothetical protein